MMPEWVCRSWGSALGGFRGRACGRMLAKTCDYAARRGSCRKPRRSRSRRHGSAGGAQQLAESHPADEGLTRRAGRLVDDLDAGVGVIDDAAERLGAERQGKNPGVLFRPRGGAGVFGGGGTT